MIRFLTSLALCLGGSVAAETPATLIPAVAQSLRPVLRPDLLTPVSQDIEAQFQTWLIEFRARALTLGITPATLNAALPGLSYDAEVVRRDRNQAEFTKTIWDYLDTAVS